MSNLPHLRAAIYSTPWALMPGHFEALIEVIERRALGIRFTPEQIAAVKGPRGPANYVSLYPMAVVEANGSIDISSRGKASGNATNGGSIAVIPVFGLISQHSSQVDDVSGPGGTSTERLVGAIQAAQDDPSVSKIVLNIDSPGGSVYGVQEAANAIFSMRGGKPMVAQCNSLCASAAYWLASACDEIAVTPSGEIGSIGVFGTHIDVSNAMGMQGLKHTMISAGKYKTEGNPYQPLDQEAFDAMQSSVNRYYNDFTGSVARGRGASIDAVKNGFGEGRVVGAKEAVKLGMADRVSTLDETLRRLGAARTSKKVAAFVDQSQYAALDNPDTLTAEQYALAIQEQTDRMTAESNALKIAMEKPGNDAATVEGGDITVEIHNDVDKSDSQPKPSETEKAPAETPENEKNAPEENKDAQAFLAKQHLSAQRAEFRKNRHAYRMRMIGIKRG